MLIFQLLNYLLFREGGGGTIHGAGDYLGDFMILLSIVTVVNNLSIYFTEIDRLLSSIANDDVS